MEEDVKKILVIRRDNIGDLACTTSFIAAVRETFPGATVDILVNDYNAPLIANHPHVDNIYVYRKRRMAQRGSTVRRLCANAALLWNIRRERYDIAFMCGNGDSSSCAQHTLLTGAHYRVSHEGTSWWNRVAYNIRVPCDLNSMHHVESLYALLEAFAQKDMPRRPLSLVADKAALGRWERAIYNHPAVKKDRALVAINISTRQKVQRWPLTCYCDLIERIIEDGRCVPLLLWSPNKGSNAKFPGDDGDAEKIMSKFRNEIVAYPTPDVRDLVAAIASVDIVVTPDGGVMHIAAGFQKPLVCFMLERIALRWYPWMTPHTLLTCSSADEISVEAVYGALAGMEKKRGCFVASPGEGGAL